MSTSLLNHGSGSLTIQTQDLHKLLTCASHCPADTHTPLPCSTESQKTVESERGHGTECKLKKEEKKGIIVGGIKVTKGLCNRASNKMLHTGSRHFFFFFFLV